jgi:hypothetical protein
MEKQRGYSAGTCILITNRLFQLWNNKPPLSAMKYKFMSLEQIGVHHRSIYVIIQKENPTRCHRVSKFYFIFIWSSTCFGQHTAHYQEPKTALAASGFAYVEGCWICSCWTLAASSNYRSNNLPRIQNQRLLVQFQAPDNGRCVARNMLSFI